MKTITTEHGAIEVHGNGQYQFRFRGALRTLDGEYRYRSDQAATDAFLTMAEAARPQPRFMYTTAGNDPTSPGQFASLSEMLSANADDPDFCRFLERAQPGDSYVAGGGAAPEFTTWRVA